MQTDTCICVFLKPPQAGNVKTRLIPVFGAKGAAALAEAFFRDTWNCVTSLGWVVPVVASTEALDPEFLPDRSAEVWLQGDGDLGARIEQILRRGLARKPFAIGLGADSPGIPRNFLEEAHQALRSTDAVLGPCDDGGFYLLGVRECRQGLLADIPWSQPTTFACTLDRLRARGLKTAILDSWFDVDRAEDLLRFSELNGAARAPYTARVIARLQEEVAQQQSLPRSRTQSACTDVRSDSITAD